MKQVTIAFLLLTLSSCKGQIIIWNGMELIGADIGAGILILLGVIVLIAIALDKYEEWRKRVG